MSRRTWDFLTMGHSHAPPAYRRHWWQLWRPRAPRIVVSGSMKGYDEYGYVRGLQPWMKAGSLNGYVRGPQPWMTPADTRRVGSWQPDAIIRKRDICPLCKGELCEHCGGWGYTEESNASLLGRVRGGGTRE